MVRIFRIINILTVLAPLSGISQTAEQVFKAAGTPANPNVNVSWNRYYTYDGLVEIMEKLEDAYPELVTLESIGQTYQGKDIMAMTITDRSTGDPESKPGFYIDGNIHSNEIQGSEVALYTAWYLVESFAENEFVNQLLEKKTFYILPSINPDARDNYMQEGNTMHSPRSGMIPVDDDRDGLEDEDGYDDRNNDGHITLMRRKNPNGRYKKSPEDPRWMVRVKPDEDGSYELLGYEGIDNDGDGNINEDRVGGVYDPNRDWGFSWQPNYIQRGAYKYPFSLPVTRAVKEFLERHPNIAGAQTYHNSGGMILRGPGAGKDTDTYSGSDKAVYDAIGKIGEQMLPGYKYMVLYKDLYTTFGGEIDWLHGGRGIYTFSNELFTPYHFFNDQNDQKGYFGGADTHYSFDELLLFKDAFVDWQPYDHPQYGQIEIGGFKKNFIRPHPGFLLETDAHRNMAFSLYHANQTPELVVDSVMEKKLGNGLYEITVVVANKKIIPTHSDHDIKNKIERPDYISLSGPKVLAGMKVTNLDLNLTEDQEYQPEKIEVPNIPGKGTVTVRWIVKGNPGDYQILIDSAKGGKLQWTK